MNKENVNILITIIQKQKDFFKDFLNFKNIFKRTVKEK